ncbi:hypothetical protein PENTCL1PPCAC_27673 [Pristionchus entomophagus]|uniref:Eef-1B.1 n=1 Tax=Pristionchus entomophagus TaxID=358040 RepID=A0AAV5UHU8_9BILA|nr:hypothetical protein PENTCL1PPCAC_27673 [Pristionchus entomophagus]
MSDGLLSEVSALLGARLAVRSADQAHFGGKQVYTSVKPSTSCGSTGSDDPLSSAINRAKQIAESALGGAGSDSSKVLSEVTALRQEVSTLKGDLAAIKGLLEKLSLGGAAPAAAPASAKAAPAPAKEQVDDSAQSLPSTSTTYHPPIYYDRHHILIVGDGDLSFSLALSRLLQDYPTRITATVLESNEEEFFFRYGSSAMDTLTLLKTHSPKTSLRFNTDGTKLETYHDIGYSSVDILVFNFPHPGGKTNLNHSRRLLNGFLRSARLVLNERAELHLALARLQSGICVTPGVLSTYNEPHHEKDSWQVLEIAASNGFLVDRLEVFNPFDFPGYGAAGYRRGSKGFENKIGAQRIVLKSCMNSQNMSLQDLQQLHQDQSRNEFYCLRPFHRHDLSAVFGDGLSITDEECDSFEERFLDRLNKLFGGLLVRHEEVLDLRSIDPGGRPNRIYRLWWQSHRAPMNKIRCNSFHNEMKIVMTKFFETSGLPLLADDEDFDLFGSDDSDDEDKKAVVAQRLKEYQEKKSKKTGPIAKSSVILDVKPWDDETKMDELEANVRSIEMDGLVWGGGKLLPIGYGINKLQIICVVEDDKVSVDDLIEKIQDGFPDHCQSVDIHAFNKI